MKIKIELKLITSISLFVAVFFLPLKTTISNFGIILLCITSIASFLKNGIDLNMLRKFRFYLTSTIILYVPFLMGTLYASSYGQAFDELERCVFYLLVPIILLRTDLSRDATLQLIAWALLLGTIACILYLHTENILRFIESGKQFKGLLSYNFTGKRFVAPLKDMHPVYLGSYFVMLLALLWNREFKLKTPLRSVVTILTVLSIVFLNSRIIFICLFIVMLTYGALYYNRVKHYLWIGVVAILVLGVSIKKTYVYNKLVKGSLWELTDNVATEGLDSKKVGDSRMARWKVAMNLIKQKPIFGYGTGTERKRLTEAYRQRGMEVSYEQQFNSHNQYLGYAIDFGVFGLLFLCVFLFTNMTLAIKHRDAGYFTFITIISVCCLTENYLTRNMGVNFVVIFGLIYTAFLKKNKFNKS